MHMKRVLIYQFHGKEGGGDRSKGQVPGKSVTVRYDIVYIRDYVSKVLYLKLKSLTGQTVGSPFVSFT